MEPYESKWADDSSHSFDIGKGPSLIPLSEADFDLEDKPDVRGWDVVGNDGGKIGEVNDLIVDPVRKKARYLDVEAESDLGREGVPRHLLIPIGAATVNKEDKEVMLKKISRDQLEKCPPFSGCPITKDFAYQLHAKLGEDEISAGSAVPSPGTDWNENKLYDHDLYDSDKFYGSGAT